MPRLSKRRLWLVLAGVVVIVLVVGFVIAVAVGQRWLQTATAQAPGVGTVVLAPEDSKAQRALANTEMDAASAAATTYLAAQPTAYWLTPEQDPIGTAGVTVTTLLSQARDQGATLALVIYGLPERDCGNHSAGGLSPDDYPRWIDEISAALQTAPDLQKIVILEPDSLALSLECDNLDARVPQLRDAVDSLAAPATWIYLDGGHSNWLPAQQMSELIRSVGVSDKVRGFATNVSNYRSSSDEFEYAHKLSSQLDGLHALVDTSRNGTASAGSEWCNPPGQTIGEASGTLGDEVVDTNLWIKPPGESDGPCHGGPAAGVWWPEGAVALTRNLE